MIEKEALKGSCLCGEVTYEALPPFITFQYCHCSRCRKVTGSAHASNILMPPQQFRWTQGGHKVIRYVPTEAKHFATSFCQTCGSNLPWLAQTGKAMVIPAGTLDHIPETISLTPERNLFWESRALWYQEPHHSSAYPTLPGKSDPCCISPKTSD